MYESGSMNDQQIQSFMDIYKQRMSVGTMVVGSVIGVTLVSFVVSLITSIFVRKEESPFSQDEVNE